MTVEVPIWLFFIICLFIYINFFMILDIAKRLRSNDLQMLINSKMVNQSFEDIAKDMDLLVKTVDKLEAENDYKKTGH